MIPGIGLLEINQSSLGSFQVEELEAHLVIVFLGAWGRHDLGDDEGAADAWSRRNLEVFILRHKLGSAGVQHGHLDFVVVGREFLEGKDLQKIRRVLIFADFPELTQKLGVLAENVIFQLACGPEFRRQPQDLEKHNQVFFLGKRLPGWRQQLAVFRPKRNRLRNGSTAFLKLVSHHERSHGQGGVFFRNRDGPFKCREFLGDRVLEEKVKLIRPRHQGKKVLDG